VVAPDRQATASAGGWALPALLLAAAALISGFTILRGGAPFDEGLVLQAARRVVEGQLPYRDFLWPYGPAEPYLLGLSFEALGPSLLWWRVLRVACDAVVAVVVFVLLRRACPLPLALLGWLTAACAMAQPTSANPFPFALLAALLAVGLASRTPPARPSPALAGVLVAVAATWRLDFGVYAGAAALAATALGPGAGGRRQRAAARLGAAALALTALAYAPFLVADGPSDLYAALVGDSLRERDHWTLPLPLPWDAGIEDTLERAVPLLALAGAAVAATLAAARWRRERALPSRDAGLLVLAAGGVLYLLSRPDEFHVTPLVVTLAALLPRLATWAVALRPRVLRLAGAGLVALVASIAVDGVSHRATALVGPPELAPIDVDVADGAQAPPAEARALEWMVATVRGLVPPGGEIYTVTRRSDLVRFNQPLVYFLTQRDNPADRDFGLLAEPGLQRATIAVLERSRPRAIVRWTDPIAVVREPNLRGEPTGSRALDAWIAAEYRLHGRRGEYEVLVPR
jgi:hypothetical protein